MNDFVTVYSLDFSKCFVIEYNLNEYYKFSDYFIYSKHEIILISNGSAIFKYLHHGCYKSQPDTETMDRCEQTDIIPIFKQFMYEREFKELINA